MERHDFLENFERRWAVLNVALYVSVSVITLNSAELDAKMKFSIQKTQLSMRFLATRFVVLDEVNMY